VYCKLKSQELPSLTYCDRKQNDRPDNPRAACEGDRSTVEMLLVFITAHQMSWSVCYSDSPALWCFGVIWVYNKLSYSVLMVSMHSSLK